MQEEKGGIEFVKWFSELNKGSIKIAGGKGANLSEIYNLKIPVPPGFVITAQAYDYFIEKSNLKPKIKELLDKIDYNKTEQLDQITKEIRELIFNAKIPEDMEKEILDSYEDLDVGRDSGVHDILKKTPENIFVAVRSSATAEDLEDASFAGQQDSFLNIRGGESLLEHIRKCFASLFTSRATYYRENRGFKHEETSLAVVVQKMVDSDKSGVIFSKDPSYKNDNVIIESVFGLGVGIVSGKITPDKHVVSRDFEILDKKIANKKIAITRKSNGEEIEVKLREEMSKSQVLKNHEIRKLAEIALKLEEHYQKPQDIEFAIQDDEIFVVQTRAITTIGKRIEKNKEGSEIYGTVILEGLAASPGVGSGKVKIVKQMADLSKVNQGDVLVTKMTNPDMVVTMQRASAIVTDEGGLTAHAAIVSREMGIPCVVGTQEATVKLKEGEIITVDGFKGKVYKGKVGESIKKEILPVTAQTKTDIKVIVDLPNFAERASKTGLKKVGLTRIEGIIAESGKHPNYFLEKNEFGEYEEIIFKGIEGIAKYFDEMWVRTSDIRSDEFQNLEGAPKEKEANPMLGMHGIRYSLRNLGILKAELNALKRISEQGKTMGILMPQVISVDELRRVKEITREIGFDKIKIGIMIETPASVQLIRDFCEEGIDFVSFGTNDLTQYILAIDRGNEKLQELYDETHPAVLRQLEYVIRIAKKYNVETSICGQAGSKKEMVKYLVERKIDSISVNADVAKEISDYVSELEGNPVEKTEEKKVEETKIEEKAQEVKEEKVEESKVEPKKEIEEKKDDDVKFEIIKDPIPENELQESEETQSEESQINTLETYDEEPIHKDELQKNIEESNDFPIKLDDSQLVDPRELQEGEETKAEEEQNLPSEVDTEENRPGEANLEEQNLEREIEEEIKEILETNNQAKKLDIF